MEDALEFAVASQFDKDAFGERDADQVERFCDLGGSHGFRDRSVCDVAESNDEEGERERERSGLALHLIALLALIAA